MKGPCMCGGCDECCYSGPACGRHPGEPQDGCTACEAEGESLLAEEADLVDRFGEMAVALDDSHTAIRNAYEYRWDEECPF